MFDRIRAHLTYSNVMVTFLALVVGGGGAVAAAGVVNKQGQISACFVKQGKNRGALRLLAKGKCTSKETKISWNERGSAGARGQSGADGQQGPPGPANGPAGGDLAGSYPNPGIAPGVVNSTKIADGTVGSADLANDSVNSAKVLDDSLTGADLGVGSIGRRELMDFTRREGTGVVAGGTVGNNVWNHGSATATCMPGEQLVAGNAAWDNENAGEPMAIVEIIPDYAASSVTVKGATDVVSDRTLRAIAICL